MEIVDIDTIPLETDVRPLDEKEGIEPHAVNNGTVEPAWRMFSNNRSASRRTAPTDVSASPSPRTMIRRRSGCLSPWCVHC